MTITKNINQNQSEHKNIKLISKLIGLSIISSNDWYNLEDFFERVDNQSLEFNWIKQLIIESEKYKNQTFKSFAFLQEFKKIQKSLITLKRQVYQDYLPLTQRFKFTENIEDLRGDKESFVIDYTLPDKQQSLDINPFIGTVYLNFSTFWLNQIKNEKKENAFKIIEQLLINDLKINSSKIYLKIKEKNGLIHEIDISNINLINHLIEKKIGQICGYLYADVLNISNITKSLAYYYYNKNRNFIPNLLQKTDSNFFHKPTFEQLLCLEQTL